MFFFNKTFKQGIRKNDQYFGDMGAALDFHLLIINTTVQQQYNMMAVHRLDAHVSSRLLR